MNKLSIVIELFAFLKERRAWWLVPIVFFLILLGFLLVFAQTSSLAPFIYTMF